MKRQAPRKLNDAENAVFKEDIAFKYADDENVLKKLSGLDIGKVNKPIVL